jgi:peptidoglycan hydrolase-like protein with peptidoglycan-binding domain
MKAFSQIADHTNADRPSSSKASFVQPKLRINDPGDIYENEADVVAGKVMRMQEPFIQSKPLPINTIHRKCEHCEEEEKKMQRKEMNADETTADHSLESYINNLSNRGQSLSDEARSFYEPRFGYDFSNVKVHTDSNAAKSAQSINALAYTSGNNIVFNSGQFSPNTDSGKKLLGHELTHVLQQSNIIHQSSITASPAINSSLGETEKNESETQDGLSKDKPMAQCKTNNILIQRQVSPVSDHLQSPRFSPSGKLERCFDDTDRLGPGDPDTDAVIRIQQALIDVPGITGNTYDLGSTGPNNDGVDGIYGPKTAAAVKKFKTDEKLGFTQFGDVGPGTMHRLDELFSTEEISVVFSESPSEKFAGYDDSVGPNSLVIPVNGNRSASVTVTPAGAAPEFVSLDPAIATVNRTPDGIVVTGHADGKTNVVALNGTRLLDALNIEVKDRRELTVDYHFTRDSAKPPHHTTRSLGDAGNLTDTLNKIWERQANVRFKTGIVDDPTIPRPLRDVVQMDDLFDFALLATGGDYNVFLVWEYEPIALDPFPGFKPPDIEGVTAVPPKGGMITKTITLVEDNACPDGLTIAHEAGHFMGLARGKGHPPDTIMSICGGKDRQRVRKADADVVNP